MNKKIRDTSCAKTCILHLAFMRIILISFILLCTKLSNAQQVELQGSYGASFIGGESIVFVGKDSFYFSGFYCTYGVHGKGRCEIRDSYLYLYFEKKKHPVKTVPLQPPLIQKTETNDSILVIDITTVNNNGEPIPYVTIQIEKQEAIKMNTLTDSLGHAIISMSRDHFPALMRTSGVGMIAGRLPLDSPAHYRIRLFHQRDELSDKELNNGEVYVYEIDELSEDLIMMRPMNSSESFRAYRKKKVIKEIPHTSPPL